MYGKALIHPYSICAEDNVVIILCTCITGSAGTLGKMENRGRNFEFKDDYKG